MQPPQQARFLLRHMLITFFTTSKSDLQEFFTCNPTGLCSRATVPVIANVQHDNNIISICENSPQSGQN